MATVNYLEKCRYYKGEEKCPYEVMDEHHYYWEAERMYVEQMMEFPEGLLKLIAKYDKYPEVVAYRNADDGVDGVLTGFLFAYYEMFTGDYRTMPEILAGFKVWYADYIARK